MWERRRPAQYEKFKPLLFYVKKRKNTTMNINTLKKLPLINQLRLVAAWFDSLEYANISEIKTLSKGYEITFYSRQEDEQETIIFKNIKQLQIFVNQNLSYSDLLEVYNEDENIIFRKREKNKNEN